MNARATAAICLPAIFLDAAAFGVLVPNFPALLQELGRHSLEASSRAAGLTLLAFALMQLLCAPFLARLSDRYGRRPVLLAALWALAIDHLVMATTSSFAILLLGRAVAGGLGGVYPVATTAMIDAEGQARAPKVFGLSSAAIGAGFVLGPALGGLAGTVSPRAPLYMAAITFALLAAGATLAFKETTAFGSRKPVRLADAVPLANLRLAGGRRDAKALLFCVFLVFAASHAYFTMWPFFTQRVVGWHAAQIGLSMVIYGTLLALVAGVCVPGLIRIMGSGLLAQASILVALLSFVGLAVSTTSTSLYFFLLLGGLSAPAVPALQSLLANGFDVEVQGELQGAVSSMQSLAAIIGPLAMSQIFAASAFPGMVFIVGAVGLLSGLAVLRLGLRGRDPNASRSGVKAAV